MRLPPQPGELIDRNRGLTFSFDDVTIEALEGDTIASALFADGRRVFSRSFKYHRPRGLYCCSGACPNCLMEVDGVPNVRACVQPASQDAVVRAQNVLPTLEWDLLSITDKVGGPFTPVGFYYRTMIRPRWAWPVYERFLRNVAGLGRVNKHARRSRRFDTEHRHAEVLVIGGGHSGIEAARQAGAEGRHVVLVHDGRPPSEDGAFETIAPARAIGIYEGGLVPVDAGDILYRFRADRIVVATGTVEQPVVFPGNDLVGVMLPDGVRRLVRDFALKPGDRAVVVSVREPEVVADLEAAGVELAEVVDLRERAPTRLEARGRRGRVQSLTVDDRRIRCDLLVVDGGSQPAYSLLAQAGARIEYEPDTGIFVPTDLPPHVEAVGSVTGAGHAQAKPLASYEGEGKCFVCICEDVTTKDMKRAVAEGFDSIELAKRYTTVTMGPCQGRLCHLPSIRFYAQATATSEAAIGTTTARPPWSPVALGLLAGRGHEPARRTALHHRHKELGARMMWTGAWRRPYAYGEPAGEVRAVHEAVGVIDVSTLGKLLVRGPDAVIFLERLYPNRFADLKLGRIRYAVLGTDAGRIMDDGTVARIGDDEFYVTTTSTGAEAVFEWFEWWNAVWQLDVEIVDATGALAAVNVAGPRARDLLARLTDLDVSADAFTYLDAKQAPVAGAPALLLRIGFVGELGYEIHVPSPYGESLWDAILDEGADLGVKPFGLEPQRILRLEKMHVIVGQDTDSESNPLEAGMPWIVKFDKDDFVGKWSLEQVQERGFRERLVGFEMENGTVPAEGGQVVVEGLPGGRVTSARWSEEVGGPIGLAWVPTELAEEGTTLEIKVDGRLERASVRLIPFYDPDGSNLRS
jgi:sarcosine oxidase, subunit alpha